MASEKLVPATMILANGEALFNLTTVPYFKYLAPERVDVLQNLKIRYTQVSALNDPFEYFPSIFSDDNNEEKEADFQRRIRSITESTLGILCLSKTPDNILMWSHYCASHTGFVLEFDSSNPYFSYGTSEVRYSSNRPRLHVRWGDQATSIFYTKALEWRYEREVRKVEALHEKIHPLENGHHLIEGDPKAPDDPSLLHLRTIPKEAITGVILGWRSTETVKGAIVNALAINAMESVRLFRAEPCRKEYRMKIAPIEEA